MHPTTADSRRHAAALIILFVAFSIPAQAQTVFFGESVLIGDGSAETWVEVDAENVPVRIGMTLTESALSVLPGTARVMSLDLPEVGLDIPFKHVMFDWAPNGHPPSVYAGHRHFDFHFFMLSEAERLQIADGVDAVPVQPEYMPQDYIAVPGLGTRSFPRMGVHYVDAEASELHGEAFSNTLIYGFYLGKMIFIEPMVTVNYFELRPDFEGAIKQPEAFQKRGYYPTTYRVAYDESERAFDVYLTGFILREGTSTSFNHPPPDLPLQLSQNHPNPFRTTTTLAYRLSQPAHLTLAIYDVLGRRVRTLVNTVLPSGPHTAVWDGRGEAGDEVGSGVYLARLQAGRMVRFQRIVRMR